MSDVFLSDNQIIISPQPFSLVDFFLSGQLGLFKMHASGVDGMDPAFFMAVLPAQDGDGNPGIHENGVNEPVEVNLQGHFDLQQHDERHHGLDEAQHRPELAGYQYIVVEDHREAGIEHIDICHHQIECGEQKEIVLQKLHDAVKDDDAVPFDAFLEKDGNVALGAVELTLGPPLSLAAGGHEAQRLFIIDDSVMNPAGTDTVGQTLHGKFHVFCEAVAAPAVFLHNIRRNAHARAAEAGGQAQVVLTQMPQVVDGPEGNGKGAGHPGVRGVLGGKVALHDLLPLQETVVHDRQKVQVHQVIGVENAESVVSFIQGKNLRKYPVHGIALAHQFLVGSFKDVGPVLTGNVCGVVGAVVCNHIHIVKLFGVFQHFQVFQKVRQHHFFIMGGNDHGEPALWRCQIFFFSMPHAAYSNDRVVNGKERHDQLHGNHDYIEYVSHYSFPSPSPPAVLLVLLAFRFAFLRFRKVFIMPNMI